jgi:pSer/pThr/pTyr-binding forkhead associated (FHA) protein
MTLRLSDGAETGESAPQIDAEVALAVSGPSLALPDGSEFALPEGVSKIGRRAGNDLVLSDAYASGSHAQILREGVSACVIDQGSTNGTFLNDSRLNPGDRAPLKSGDRVRFGNTETVYTWDEEESPSEAAEEDAAEDSDDSLPESP